MKISYIAILAATAFTLSLEATDVSAQTMSSTAGGAGYPIGAIPQVASATGTTAATTASLPNTAGLRSYICGFSILANATAAATGNATVTNLAQSAATLNFTQWTAPLASGIGNTTVNFSPCLAAAGTGFAISVVSAAPGSGGTVSVSAWGYQQ